MRHFNLALTPGVRRVLHSTYPLIIQHALTGTGVALGWRGVVDGLLEAEMLCPVGPEVASDRHYEVTYPTSSETPAAEAAAEWMADEWGGEPLADDH